ncbi:hypothetical protein SeLEV6574_g05674 [Synchytrium endobioticum]|nr:hypothetical protein SeLEV6574_g05674 [Synchytrium endobioticum]
MLDPDVGWIALVLRGNCSFVQKIRAMQASGAKAVIVADLYDSPELITMYASDDTADITIPSVFISKDSFRDLSYLSQYASSAHAPSHTTTAATHGIQSLERPRHLLIQLERNETQIPFIDLILLAVLSPLSVLFCLCSLWQIIVQRRRRQSLAAQPQALPDPPHDRLIADQEYINNLPIKTYCTKEAGPDMDVCAVCLDEYADDDQVRILNCNHEFHQKCIDPWLLTRSSTCPTCKAHVGPPETEPDATESTPLLANANQPDSHSDALVNALANPVVIDLHTVGSSASSPHASSFTDVAPSLSV